MQYPTVPRLLKNDFKRKPVNVLKNTKEYLKYLLDQEEWTSEEKEWMLQYLEKDDLAGLEAVASEAFRDDVESPKPTSDRRHPAQVLEQIHQRIGVAEPAKRGRVRIFWRISAAAAVVLGLFVGAGYFFHTRSNPSVAGNTPGAGSKAASVMARGEGEDMEHAITAMRERKSVRLPDGTGVQLEQGSVLDYPRQFKGKTRDVYLKGEAFFDVKKDDVPFIVHTRFVETTVLGTSFNVDASSANEARVVVVTGKVKVAVPNEGKEGRNVIIEPRQAGIYYVLPDKLEKIDAADDALFYQQRRSGSFVYPGVAVGKVVEDMQRFYHTRLVLQGQMQSCIFHGHFHTSDDLDKALSLIAIPLNANIRKDTIANAYVIYGGSCQ